jgi:UDP-N-acetylglucosamine--N-acetylmuramyl-(pentapeptide) pyrophosphoryl-undecaprenol N-acetylglucosamine transferase
MKLIFTGGGSGGHIFPIIAVIKRIKENYQGEDLEIYYLGPREKKYSELLKKEGVKVKAIAAGKWRRYFSLKNLIDIFKIPLGILQSFFWLFVLMPDLVFSKGGFGSFPVALSAKILGIPLVLHESDIAPGLASKIESRWAQEVFVSFPDTEYFPKDKMILIGNPIRESILKADKKKAESLFGIPENRPVILILGGSQGSRRINDIVLDILPDLLKTAEVIHQTGEKDFKRVKAESNAVLFDKVLKRYYHIFPFLNGEQLGVALARADLVVSRAGAGSIFEIAALGKPALLIPLPESAQNHQIKNAYKFAESGGGEVIEEKNLTPHFFLEKIKFLLSNPGFLQNMSYNSSSFSHPKAAEIIASYIVEYLKMIKG